MVPSKVTSKTFFLQYWRQDYSHRSWQWQSKPNEVRDAIKVALKKEYRHINTALAYGKEHEVGAGIKDSSVSGEEIWLTMKLNHIVPEGIESSLKSLGTDYANLYLN